VASNERERWKRLRRRPTASGDLFINRITLPTIFRGCLFREQGRRSSPTRQNQKIYHGYCDSLLATGCGEPRTNLGCFQNQMEKPSAMVLLLYVMIMTVVDLLPSPVSYEACWFVRKYICCKNYGSNRPLVGINSPCGIYFCGQVFSPPLRLHRLYSNDELL